MRSRFLSLSATAATEDEGADRDVVFEWLDLVFGEVWRLHDAERFEIAVYVDADDDTLEAEAVDGLGGRLKLGFVVRGGGTRLGRGRAQVPDLSTALHLVALVCQSFGVPAMIRSNAKVPMAVEEWSRDAVERIGNEIDIATSHVRQGACHMDGVEHLVLQLEDGAGRQSHVLFSCGAEATVLGDERVGVPDLWQALHLSSALLAELRAAGMPR